MSSRIQSRQKLEGFTSYDIFIAMLSILSILNIFLFLIFSKDSILYVIGIVDIFLSIIFLFDFLHRLKSSKSKKQYFFKDYGWADLLASVPFPQLKLLRIFRLIKAYGIIRRVGLKNVFQGFLRERASSALYVVLFTIILLLEFASISILLTESNNPDANINTASDAIWWVYVTITTVGYGDQYPVTNQGRAIGMLVMFVGVGLFGVLTGFLANKFLAPADADNQQSTEFLDLKKDLKEIKQLLNAK
jgi:hypothetical protein